MARVAPESGFHADWSRTNDRTTHACVMLMIRENCDTHKRTDPHIWARTNIRFNTLTHTFARATLFDQVCVWCR